MGRWSGCGNGVADSVLDGFVGLFVEDGVQKGFNLNSVKAVRNN